jgi:hypothetical protein
MVRTSFGPFSELQADERRVRLTESFAQVGSSYQSSLVSPAAFSSVSSENDPVGFGLLSYFCGPSVPTLDVAGERTEGTRWSSP